MSCDKCLPCVSMCVHHHKQDTEHFCHPPYFPDTPFSSVLLPVTWGALDQTLKKQKYEIEHPFKKIMKSKKILFCEIIAYMQWIHIRSWRKCISDCRPSLKVCERCCFGHLWNEIMHGSHWVHCLTQSEHLINGSYYYYITNYRGYLLCAWHWWSWETGPSPGLAHSLSCTPYSWVCALRLPNLRLDTRRPDVLECPEEGNECEEW